MLFPKGRTLSVLSLTVAALCVVFVALAFQAGAQPNKAGRETAKAKDAGKDPFPNAKMDAPELEGGVGWLNTSGPITMESLKGKVVLLDFWTYCCINCIHILPDLDKLEKKYPNELVVIGVHSAKFDNEKESNNIREAIMRYQIEHPVVNDANMAIWRRFGVRAWPTRILIDPEGHVIGMLSGEGNYELLDEVINKLIAYHDQKGTLDRSPVHFNLEETRAASTPLRFPGKVLPDPEGNRLFIADSSHHRLVIADLKTGKVLDVIGDGKPELKDGGYSEARFNDPQGMALKGDKLYVADRKNHALREVDLKSKKVITLSGNGKRGRVRRSLGKGPEVELASPWDLLLIGDELYIAMAGTHQIWMMNLDSGSIGPFAGTGGENITDGTLRSSEFAQPSGLATDGTWLYVADSEVSAIRKIHLKKDLVDTVIGEGLFEFGDVDGTGSKARLQHALGVDFKDGKLYVADTYNNKIKTIDPKSTESLTYLGDGKPGDSDAPARFNEPGGLSIVGDKAYVADTNNHAIRVIDLGTKKVSTFPLTGLEPPASADQLAFPSDAKPVSSPAAVLKPEGTLTIDGTVAVPAGQKLSPFVPLRYRVRTKGHQGDALVKGSGETGSAAFGIEVPLAKLAGAKDLLVDVVYYSCGDGSEGLCRVGGESWSVPVSFDAANGTTTIKLPSETK
ncbi:Thiol-disulfide oxidoreductase YkuV [Planctomycetes bacterium Pan216]|uniref:Thiol-disulfide oxidoreductase YkuV n=1 Tax=Kolteria novifilia TaxID=2527975 RepID=A0A518BCN3_9BACT|nr:Thiol-disulfide oxidoreductase YkuV [Planctomycetes bacterium Pan216]